MQRIVPSAALLLVAFLFASPVHAQFNTGGSPLSLIISPQNPKPYDTVTVTPDSGQFDLISSVVTVSVNGKVVEKGSGAQSVPVTVGGPGESTKITVTAVNGGQTYSASATLRPADVSLIIEPDSATHPFYLGAPLVAPQGQVRLVALPDLRTTTNVRLNPANLIYTWKLGDQILTADSGIGKSVLVAIAPVRYRDAQISVTVTNSDSTIVASAATVVSPADPVVRIYHNDALMGPDFNVALIGTYLMQGEEDAFRGVAYFFGSAPSLSWSVNGQSVSDSQDVTVRTTGSGAGLGSLALKAATSAQNKSQNLQIQFGANRSTNIFGF